MAKSSKRERRPAKLQCNECGHKFVGRAGFVSIESSDLGTLGWTQDTGGTKGNRCPQCGSGLIRFRD
jgi:DNA-directed RNA polymerase subunit RPC12/RpoP